MQKDQNLVINLMYKLSHKINTYRQLSVVLRQFGAAWHFLIFSRSLIPLEHSHFERTMTVTSVITLKKDNIAMVTKENASGIRNDLRMYQYMPISQSKTTKVIAAKRMVLGFKREIAPLAKLTMLIPTTGTK